jgi:hypothetical protein
MSNSEPSAIVLHRIACIGGLYIISIRIEKTDGSRFAAIILAKINALVESIEGDLNMVAVEEVAAGIAHVAPFPALIVQRLDPLKATIVI